MRSYDASYGMKEAAASKPISRRQLQLKKRNIFINAFTLPGFSINLSLRRYDLYWPIIRKY